MNSHRKTLSVTDWSNLQKILEAFEITTAQTEGVNLHRTFLPFYGSAPSDAHAIVFPRTRIEDFHSLILFDRYRGKAPGVSVALDILHEAAHIILKDIERDEDDGVAQVELALAYFTSPTLFKSMVWLQKNQYTWNTPYENIILASEWKRGNAKAKRAIQPTYAYPWKTVQEHRKAIQNALLPAKKSHPSA